MPLSTQEKLALARKHAPILWLHGEEAFLPEDCAIAAKISGLYRGKRGGEKAPNQPQSLDDLGGIKDSEKYLLRFRDFNLDEKLKKLGPWGVGDYARGRYHFSLPNIPTNGSTFSRTLPKYYARVSEFTFYPKDTSQLFSGYFRSHHPEVFGNYYLIEYFFYFVFNDAWNMHQSDWDSTVKVYINRQNGRMYVATHMHREKWISQWPVASPTPALKTWSDRWNSLRKRDLGEVFVRGNHPYVFVALQAHGSYPTPGFTLHGIDFPRAVTRSDVLITADERQLGATCIVPGGISTDSIRTELEAENVSVASHRFQTWKAPELVDKQPWLNYRGFWGDVSAFLGWSGPRNPPISAKRTRDENWKAFGKDLQFQLADWYRSRTVQDSWHGIR